MPTAPPGTIGLVYDRELLTIYLAVDRFPMTTNSTRGAVLDVAEELVQTRGFHSFSFRDLAERVRIKSSSVHYYFATKGELCQALIARQREQLEAALASFDDQGLDPPGRLEQYASVYQGTLETGNRMCLFGMLASDFGTLGEAIAGDLRQSFDLQVRWLSGVLAEGLGDGSLWFEGSVEGEAQLLLTSLEGAMLVARVYEDPSRFEAASRLILDRVRPTPRPI